MKTKLKTLSWVFGATVLVFEGSARSAECPANSSGPDICVEWDQPGNIIVGTHVDIDYSTPLAPKVTFRAAAGWTTWSKDSAGNPANIGPIGVAADAALNANFGLELRNLDTGAAGALDVIEIDFVHPDTENWTGHSSITGGKIATLSGDLIVQADDSPTPAGGDLDIEITGNAVGDITAESISRLIIGGSYDGFMDIKGDLDGELSIGLIKQQASGVEVFVRGNVHEGSTVTIGNFDTTVNTPSQAQFGESHSNFNKGYFKFTNELTGGYNANLILFSECDGCTVDFNDHDFNGRLDMHGGGNVQVINMEEMKLGSKIDLSLEPAESFTGQIEMTRLGGTLQWDKCGGMDGRIIINGPIDNHLSETKCVNNPGQISSGTIQATGMGPGSYFGVPKGDAWEADPNGVKDSGLIRISGTIEGEISFGAELKPEGEFRGRMELGTLVDGSKVTINNIVPPAGRPQDGHVQINYMLTEGGTRPDVNIYGEMKGTFKLINGVPAGHLVTVNDLVSGTVDLNSSPVDGTLDLLGGAAASGKIEYGQDITGTVTLGDGVANGFAGTATFSQITSGGKLCTKNSAPLDGTAKITGNVHGTIDVDGDLGSNGTIWVVSNLGTGFSFPNIIVGGATGGTIQIDKTVYNNASITLNDMLQGSSIDIGEELNGEIILAGSSDGGIGIEHGTGSASNIEIAEGMKANSSILINASLGDHTADGDILLGSEFAPLPDIEARGCISIEEYTTIPPQADPANLNGDINIVGCHSASIDIDICAFVDRGSINIDQGGCDPQRTITYSCQGDCPPT